MPNAITYRGTREQLRARLSALPGILSGRIADPSGAARGLILGLGTALLGKVQDNFVHASEGAVNELTGQPWEPLAPTTLALRNKQAGAKVIAKLERELPKLSRARRVLIQRQFQRALQLYGNSALGTYNGPRLRRAALGILQRMKGSLTPSRYKKLRAELTAKPKKDKPYRMALAAAHALPLRDTGRLFNSLSPALQGSGDQVLKLLPGQLTIGTNVAYAVFHDSPKPRKARKSDGKPRLPRRQFLPDGEKPLPLSWRKAAVDALAMGLRAPSFWTTYLGA
jgi:phage gpG-like protein